MTRSDPPQPPVDPETEGIPSYADDDSTAFDEADRPRFRDSPPALPADEPQAVDEHGVTPAEALRGEPLDDLLAREEPEIGADDAGAIPASGPADHAAGTAAATGLDQPESGRQVGRLVEPDEGVRQDTEPHLIARDAGAAGGGPSAEEAAMHEVFEDDLRPEG